MARLLRQRTAAGRFFMRRNDCPKGDRPHHGHAVQVDGVKDQESMGRKNLALGSL